MPDESRCRPPRRARRCPTQVPLADAVANVAAAAQLVLGIERSDLDLIARGLADRLHQPHRAPPLPALDGAGRRGAPSSARSARRSRAPGPTVLVWSLLAGHGQGGRGGRGAATAAGPRSAASPFTPAGRRRAGALRPCAVAEPEQPELAQDRDRVGVDVLALDQPVLERDHVEAVPGDRLPVGSATGRRGASSFAWVAVAVHSWTTRPSRK